MKKEYITIDDRDIFSLGNGREYHVGKIIVWKDYKDRSKGKVGKLKHGKKVRLLKRDGECVKIGFGFGKIGFITYWFVKEFKYG